MKTNHDAIPETVPTFHVGDDGTLDTLIICDQCNATLRYNFEGTDPDGTDVSHTYADFIDWAKSDAAENHVCGDEGTV